MVTTSATGIFRMSGPRTIPDLLRATASRLGPRVAVQMRRSDDDWQRYTFQEVHDRASEFAAGLLALGFRPGDHAAILLENSPDWVVSYFGISMAGGASVPIYYELGPEEIAHILRQSDSRIAIVSPRVVGKLPRPEAVPDLQRLIVVDSSSAVASGTPWHRACVTFDEATAAVTQSHRAVLTDVKTTPDQLVQLLYTSGTTGNPKGVMLTHANITANVEQARRRLPVDERDHILLVLPLHHAFPLIALVLAVAIGCTVTFENDLRRVAERMAEVRPTIFLGVPALYALMMRRIMARAEEDGRAEQLRRALHLVRAVKRITGLNIGPVLFRNTIHKRLGGKMRFMISGGAALPPEVAHQYYNLGLLLVQGWGLTETSPVVSVQEVSRFRFLFTRFYERQLGTVGRPLDGVELRLVDVPDKQVFVHQHGQGELVLRGPNVMVGYYKNEEATAEAFMGGSGSDRWLHTGDIGRVDEMGNIYITGRTTDVIVLASGEKVYPDEVEEKLLESPLVEEIAVVSRLVLSAEDEDQDVSPAPGPGTASQRAAEAAGRVVAWAVAYPSYDALLHRAVESGEPLSEHTVRQWVMADLRRLEQDLAPFKRMAGLTLSDRPLPKTALRKVKRNLVAHMLAQGQIEFTLDQLRASAQNVAAAASGG